LERVVEETDVRPDDMAVCLLSIEGDAGAAPAVLLQQLELDAHEAAGERTERFLLACGVEPHRLGELARSARVAAGQAGTVLLEVRLTGGSPEVALQPYNVAPLHVAQARRRAALGAG
jgi:hypothetical protein